MSDITTRAPDAEDNVCEAIMMPWRGAPRMETATSRTEAQELVRKWEGTPDAATITAPVLFLIGPNGFVHDGTEGVALNRVEVREDSYPGAQKKYSVGEGQYSTMVTSSLPAASYDRAVRIDGCAWGEVQSGSGQINLMLTRAGEALAGARFPQGTNSTVAVSRTVIIPAGESPAISMSIYGAFGGTGTIMLSPNKLLTRLTVTATPYAA